jgi:hypothetical protein
MKKSTGPNIGIDEEEIQSFHFTCDKHIFQREGPMAGHHSDEEYHYTESVIEMLCKIIKLCILTGIIQ